VPLVIGNPTDACKYLVVDGAAHLTVGPAAVVKFFTGGSMSVNNGGVLTIQPGDHFTAFIDDARGGDTNADSGSLLPQAGDELWYGIKTYHQVGEPTCDMGSHMHYQTLNDANGCTW
jgi:hypothetical protein